MNNYEARNNLMILGLTGQEANLYILLLQNGELTGYEAAKQLNISRSNAYVALASLVEKGASYLKQENSIKRYTPVPLQEFCLNVNEKIERAGQWLFANLNTEQKDEEGYVTIEGDANILQKIKHLMDSTHDRVYLSCKRDFLHLFSDDIKKLLEAQKKVVIITDAAVKVGAAKVYITSPKGAQMAVIVDSKYVLMGEYGDESNHTGLFTGQKNFVNHYKKALANEIKLIEYMKGDRTAR